MAVGQVLTSPEAGWIRTPYSNSAFTFYGAWNVTGADKYTSTAGDRVTFGFTGTKLRVLMYSYPNTTSKEAVIIIDGVTYNVSTRVSPYAQDCVVTFEKLDLPAGAHNATIVAGNSGSYMYLHSIDTESGSSVQKWAPKQRTKIDGMQVGDAISCEYTATSGVFGTFSKLGAATAAALSATSPSATPNGSFNFVMVGYDILGRRKLMADRIIQTGISYHTLNAAGVCTGISASFAPSGSILRLHRAIRGNAENEWTKIIQEGNLGGQRPKGDDTFWHYTGLWQWSASLYSGYALECGHTSGDVFTGHLSNGDGFRPMLLVPYTEMSVEVVENSLNRIILKFGDSLQYKVERISGGVTTELVAQTDVPSVINCGTVQIS